MFIEKDREVADTVYTFKKREEVKSGVRAFKRKINGEEVIFVQGLDGIDKDSQTEFVQLIEQELEGGKITKAEARFLTPDNKTWFNIIQRSRKGSNVPMGQYVAYSTKMDELASLSYVARRALVSGKTEFLVSVSSSKAPNAIYEQLMKSFIRGVVMPQNKEENKDDCGLTIFVNVEEYNEQSKKLVKKMEQNPKAYGCKHGSYFGQNEEDYRESVYYYESLPASQITKKEAVEKKMVM